MGPNGTLGMAVQTWPTPNALDGEEAPEKFAGGNPSLPAAAKTWSPPRATDGEKGGPNQAFGAGGVPLPAMAAQWPTPTSLSFGDSHQPGNSRSYNKTMELAAGINWATPATANRKSARAMTASRKNGRRSGGGQSSPPGLEQQAEIAMGETPPEMVGLDLPPATKAMLAAAGLNWSTPSVADVMGGRKARSGSRADEALMNGQALALSSDLLAPETSTPGDMSPSSLLACYRRYRATTDFALRWERRALLLLAIRRRDALAARKPAKHGGAQVRAHRRGWTRERASAWVRPTFRRQLNARFVEWLMSWPPGLTSFECSETALLTHKALWRSELACMTSLPAAAPAQLSLFG